METLKNDVFFQNFVEELGDKQVLLINKNKKIFWYAMTCAKGREAFISKYVN